MAAELALIKTWYLKLALGPRPQKKSSEIRTQSQQL